MATLTTRAGKGSELTWAEVDANFSDLNTEVRTADKGGTGHSSFTVGDLFYADTTTTLAKLPAGTLKAVLRSNGAGVAPSWGAIDLSTSVAASGTLTVGRGGTGVATLTGIAKGNGTGAFTAASAGTDYVAPSGALGTPASGNLTNCTFPFTPITPTTLNNGTLPASFTSLNGGPLAGFRQKLINATFAINQRGISGTVTLAAGAYGHDRWKAGASGCTYTFSTTNNVTTLTISAGSLQQVIEGVNLDTGTYCLSWSGTATGKIAAGSYSASGVTASVTGGTNTTIEFSTGTLSRPQFEPGTVGTPAELRPDELLLCQKYYYRAQPGINYYLGGLGWAPTTSRGTSLIRFPVTMRIAPTAIEQSGTATDYGAARYGVAGNTICSSAPVFIASSTEIAQVAFDTAAVLTAGMPGTGYAATANAFLGFSAEL